MGKMQPNAIRQQPVFCYTFENLFNNFAEAIENITNVIAAYGFDYSFINFSNITIEKQSDLLKYEKEYSGNIFVYQNESEETKYKKYDGYILEFLQEERLRHLVYKNIDFCRVVDSLKIYTAKDLSEPCLATMTIASGQPPFYATILNDMFNAEWVYLEDKTFVYSDIETMPLITEEEKKKYKNQYENGAVMYMYKYNRLMDCDFLLIYSVGDYPLISHLYFSANTKTTEKLMKEKPEIKPLIKDIAEKRLKELRKISITTPYLYMGEFFNDIDALKKLIDKQIFAYEKILRI